MKKNAHHLTPNMLYLLVWGLSGLVMTLALLSVISSQKLTELWTQPAKKPAINVAEIAPAKINGIIGFFLATGNKIQLASDQTINLPITVDTRAHRVVGATAYLTYDPSVISVDNIAVGKIFQDFSCSNMLPVNGIINCRAGVGTGSPFSGRGTLASLTIRGIAKGTTTLTFKFVGTDPDSCSLTESGTNKNVLSKVVNLEVTVP